MSEQPGDADGFYSVASDAAGNVQPTPDVAQTNISVVATPILTPTPLPAIVGGPALIHRKLIQRSKPVG